MGRAGDLGWAFIGVFFGFAFFFWRFFRLDLSGQFCQLLWRLLCGLQLGLQVWMEVEEHTVILAFSGLGVLLLVSQVPVVLPM